MTTSSSTFRRLFLAATVSLIFVAVPATVFAASVQITSVMYDPPGADPGHEWVQITNNSAAAVDLTGWRFAEGGTNHKLAVVAGTSSLAAGGVAVIATDPVQYAIDHPEFSGTVFKSSFSLSNTGETIELKDAKLNIVDTYSYTAPPKVAAPKPVAVKTVKKSSSTATKPASANTTAAAAELAMPSLPQISSVWLYGLALVALLMIGAGGALYARLVAGNLPRPETSSEVMEFELE